jgi:hypothetical protein
MSEKVKKETIHHKSIANISYLQYSVTNTNDIKSQYMYEYTPLQLSLVIKCITHKHVYEYFIYS